MAMRRCLMKLQNTGLCARSNNTSGLLSKQNPHHHQLKLHGVRALSEGPRGTSSANPDSKSGSPQVHHSPSSMESEIEKLRIEMKMMHSELRHISELTKSNPSQRKLEAAKLLLLIGAGLLMYIGFGIVSVVGLLRFVLHKKVRVSIYADPIQD